MQSFKSTACQVLVAGMLLAGTGCHRGKVILPPQYNQQLKNGTTLATIPAGFTLEDTIAVLKCGSTTCEVLDLRRIFYIKIRGKEILLKDAEGKADLPKLLKCGEKYICQIDSTEKITIVRKK